MNGKSVVFLVLFLFALLVTAGCTQPATPPVTPVPTMVATPPPSPPTAVPTTLSLTPGPTQTLLDMWSLDVQVASNGFSPDPQIITTVRGGKGLNFIQQIDVRVTRSDGIVENGVIAKPLKIGDFISLASTNAPGRVDRAEVWATTPQGNKVKIYDDYVCFRCF